jgi:hypothetical protein
MRVSINLLWVLAAFFALADVAYSVWAVLYYGRVEWIGTIGIALTAVMAIFIGFYLNRSFRAQGGDLPEDRLEASVDDGDPEVGFFSPWSWWPFMLGLTGALAFLSLAVGWWIFAFAIVAFIPSITGWVYEYYRGLHAR